MLVSLRTSHCKRSNVAACFGDLNCDPLGDLAESASSPKSPNVTPVHVSMISRGAPRWVRLKSGNIKELIAVDKLTKMTRVTKSLSNWGN